MTTVAVARNQLLRRRSNRMALKARIGLSGQDREKCTFTMPARATNLNRHGAAIQLNRELPVGSTVVVRNSRGASSSGAGGRTGECSSGSLYLWGRVCPRRSGGEFLGDHVPLTGLEIIPLRLALR